MVVINKNLGYIFLAVVILTGCNDSVNQAEANSQESQIGIVDEYKKLNKEKNYSLVIYKFDKEFGQKSTTELSEEIRSEYSKAVYGEFEKSINSYNKFSDERVDYSLLNEETKKAMDKKMEDLKASLKIDIPKLLDAGKYDEILEKSILNSLINKDEELNLMVLYSKMMREKELGNTIDETIVFENVSLTNNGVYAKKLRKLVDSDFAVYRQKFETYTEEQEGLIAESEIRDPVIGMTAEDVVKSTWGKPQSINRTVTKNNVKEQWVYGNGQYLYFENNVMISFQD